MDYLTTFLFGLIGGLALCIFLRKRKKSKQPEGEIESRENIRPVVQHQYNHSEEDPQELFQAEQEFFGKEKK